MKHTAVKPARRLGWQTLFLAAVVLLIVGFGTYVGLDSLPPRAFNGQRAYDYLKQLCALGPRRSGSAAMTKQRELLIAHFKQLGGQVELQKFSAPHPLDGSPVPMANLIVRWHPERAERILLCGHYDTLPFPLRDPVNRKGPFVGANDNGSGVALLMELARDMPSLGGTCGVDFVLFDAEEFIFAEDGHYFLGSEHFASQYAADHAKYHYRCAVLLDMVGAADLRIYPETFSVSWEDSRWLTDEIWATASRLGVAEFKTEPMIEVRDDHLPLHDIAGIPACDVIGIEYPPWHTQGDTPDKCSAASLAKVGWVIREWLKTAVQARPANQSPGP
jgi:hypothetical protein